MQYTAAEQQRSGDIVSSAKVIKASEEEKNIVMDAQAQAERSWVKHRKNRKRKKTGIGKMRGEVAQIANRFAERYSNGGSRWGYKYWLKLSLKNEEEMKKPVLHGRSSFDEETITYVCREFSELCGLS